jgi:hypothetical protein
MSIPNNIENYIENMAHDYLEVCGQTDEAPDDVERWAEEFGVLVSQLIDSGWYE